MKRALFIALTMSALVGPTVQADLTSSSWSSPVQGSLADPRDGGCYGPLVPADRYPVISTPATRVIGTLGSGDLGLVHEPAGEGTIREFPPAPDSAALFLCAVGTLGAVQLGRSARNLHFGHVPEWVHSGGPRQIGHAFALDLDLINVLVPCSFEKPTIPRPCRLGFELDTHSHFEPCFKALLISPRAPPRLA